MKPRTRFLVLGAVVLLVQIAVMASVWIPVPHNGGDNAGYVALAHSLLSGQGYVEAWDPALPPHTKYPPVFPAILAVAIAAGARSWLALKAVPALFTTLAVLVTYVWASRRRDPVFGAVLATLFALSPTVLWYSHWVLSDMPFVALTFLALFALERGMPARAGADAPGSSDETVRPVGHGWVVVGLVTAGLAYFTRSAGLPLLVALAGFLVLRRRWRILGAFAVTMAIPAGLWLLRGLAGRSDGYVGEFWMVNPYRPELGTIGASGLVGRAASNAGLYVTEHLPAGLVGGVSGAAVFLLVVLLALAAAGWFGRLRHEPHVAELFVPLYAGLILLWPEVWSGDRFALPLLPLVLFYAGDALVGLLPRLRPELRVAGPVLALAGGLAVAVPAAGAWWEAVDQSRQCRASLRASDGSPAACYPAAWGEFLLGARWSGVNLPEGAVVLSRKPRFFYLTSGVPSVTYPFTAEADAFLAEAARVGARYVLLDAIDRQGITYVGGTIQARPGAFCAVRRFDQGGAGARLFGLVDPYAGLGATVEPGPDGPTVSFPACPAGMIRPTETTPPPPTGLRIPLLDPG